MKNYDKYKVLKEELKAPKFENEDEEIEWFTTQLYGLYKQSYRLRQENQQLEERINKAIEYMKNNATSNYFDKEKNMFRREEDLLEILKGEN